MLTLLGVVVVVVGFAARLNPLLVVILAAFTTGLFAGLSPLGVLAAFGKAFNENRFVTVAYLVLPMVGVLERAGLQERARALIARLRGVSVGPFLVAYLALRQITSAIGLHSIAGQAQSIRPLVAPMAEGAVEASTGAPLDADARQAVRAQAAATDNIGLFFGEDIFIAIGSILLMVGILASSGIVIDPLHLSLWAIPTAIVAFLIHGARLILFDRRLRRKAGEP
jgi:Predicted membrane protein